MKTLDAFKDRGDVIWDIANLLRGPYRALPNTAAS